MGKLRARTILTCSRACLASHLVLKNLKILICTFTHSSHLTHLTSLMDTIVPHASICGYGIKIVIKKLTGSCLWNGPGLVFGSVCAYVGGFGIYKCTCFHGA